VATRNHHRVAQQVGSTYFFDAAQFFAFNRAELGKVHFGPRDQAQASSVASAAALVLRSPSGGLHRTAHDRTGEGLHIQSGDAAFGAAAFDLIQWHAQLAGELAHGRRRMG
jgi:hypothetical protein